MFLETAALSRGASGKERMNPRDGERRIVDRQLVLRHSHWHGSTDQTPRRRIEVLPVNDIALGIYGPVDDVGDVERLCGQGQQPGLFLGVAIHRTCLGLAMDVYIGDFGQPPYLRFIQVLQGPESPTAQEARFNIAERPLHFSLGLRPAGTASYRSKAVMSRKSQEPGIVDRLVVIVTGYHNLHIVIKTSRGNPAQVRKARMCSRMVVAKS